MKENEKYPITDWQYDVACGYTQLGYGDWIEHKQDSNSCPVCGESFITHNDDGSCITD